MTYFLPRFSARMTTSPLKSDQIRKAFLGAPEIRDSKPEKERHDHDAQDESRKIELARAAEDAPAEAVDNADDGIEAVPEAPAFRDHGAREADRRDVEPELDDKR